MGRCDFSGDFRLTHEQKDTGAAYMVVLPYFLETEGKSLVERDISCP